MDATEHVIECCDLQEMIQICAALYRDDVPFACKMVVGTWTVYLGGA